MTFSSPLSLHPTSVRHHDRGLTLVIGSDGQVSLLGFDGGITSQVPYTLTTGDLGAITTSTYSVPSESASISPPPDLDATSATSTDPSSFASSTPTSTDTSSDASTTDTDTNLPSVPTIYYPTPNPAPVSDPKDHGIGAPFYLAMVLASISFIGCIAAFIAWWIRSRTRGRALEDADPWDHDDTVPDTGGSPEKANEIEKENDEDGEDRRYYVPPSILRKASSRPTVVTHAAPTAGGGAFHGVVVGRYPSLRRAQNPRSQAALSSRPNQNAPLSQTTNPYPRPGMVRLPTGLSVQESTRTLGELRVANRVPGDITSGDEGGMNNGPRVQSSTAVPPVTNTGTPLEDTMQNPRPDQSDRLVPEGDVPLEPPGPATFSWGRRTDTIAALRRTAKRAPETTVQTYKNARYGGYLYPALDGAPSGTISQATSRENTERAPENNSIDTLGWKNSLRSSFWQAVDAMTGTRPLDPAANTGGGSRFTPAPQRVASRRSPVSSTHPSTGTRTDSSTILSRDTESKYELTLSGESVATQTIPRISISDSSTRGNELQVSHTSEDTIRSSLPPGASHLNRDLGASAHPNSVGRTDTGSLYSTDTAAARANLRKYGYGDSIPSSWSALGASRESQLDVGRMYLPLPRSIRSPSPSLLSKMPSQLTLETGLSSGSASTHTRTRASLYSESLIGSDASVLRPRMHAHSANSGETASSTFSVSRNGTVQSGHSTLSTVGNRSGPSHTLSTTSSMLSRKKGVTIRRKRPKPPPRAPSSASSVQSVESGRSIGEVAVRRALLERRKKVKVAESLKSRKDGSVRSREASSTNI